MSNPMLSPRISKVTVNMGVGKAGEPLDKAVEIMTLITKQKPIRTISNKRIPTWDLRPGTAIGCKVTLRGQKAKEFLKAALEAAGNKLKLSSFDNSGNLSFGVKEHIDMPGIRYDPKLGVRGFDVCVTLQRPGYRVSTRSIKDKIGKKHRISREEAMSFFRGIGVNLQ